MTRKPPARIATALEEARTTAAARQRAGEREAKARAEAARQERLAAWHTFADRALPLLPELMRKFALVPDDGLPAGTEGLSLYLYVPGLAPLRAEFDPEPLQLSGYRVAYPEDGPADPQTDLVTQPIYYFDLSVALRTDFPDVLLKAEEQAGYMDSQMARFKADKRSGLGGYSVGYLTDGPAHRIIPAPPAPKKKRRAGGGRRTAGGKATP